jgi:Zn-dependent protease with chaperone function
MTDEQFANLVHKLEIFARQKPDLYKFCVGTLAILGYAYIFGVVALLLGLIILICAAIFYMVIYGRVNGYLVGKVLGGAIAIPAVILWATIKALFVRFSVPQGLELTKKQVPKLFNLIDELRSALKCAPFHRVLIVGDFNDMVVQRPRFGIFCWQQNYLIICLPLMQSLTPMQFKAVLAHEFGHLSGNHSKFAAWVYRIRKTWWQLMETLTQSVDRSSGFIFEVFFNWYAPFFNA